MKREHLIWILLGGAALVALYFFFTSKNTAASSAVGGVTLATPSGVNGGTPAIFGLLQGLFGGSSSSTPAPATSTQVYALPAQALPTLSADEYSSLVTSIASSASPSLLASTTDYSADLDTSGNFIS